MTDPQEGDQQTRSIAHTALTTQSIATMHSVIFSCWLATNTWPSRPASGVRSTGHTMMHNTTDAGTNFSPYNSYGGVRNAQQSTGGRQGTGTEADRKVDQNLRARLLATMSANHCAADTV